MAQSEQSEERFRRDGRVQYFDVRIFGTFLSPIRTSNVYLEFKISKHAKVQTYVCSKSILRSAFEEHENLLVKQLLNKSGVSQSWSEVVLQISHQIVDCIRPDPNHYADIRHYVLIKKSPGGSKSDCEIVSGVVCSKNVSHRAMDAMIGNPRILLLRCGLMYQRVEGKLLSLEPVMMQVYSKRVSEQEKGSYSRTNVPRKASIWVTRLPVSRR